MKTSFKKFMGVEAPKVPKPLPEPKEPHPVPNGYKRVKDGSFYKLVKEEKEILDDTTAYEMNKCTINHDAHLSKGDSKRKIITFLLKHLKEILTFDPDDGNLNDEGLTISADELHEMIHVLKKNGYDWPELNVIKKELDLHAYDHRKKYEKA